MAGVAIALEYVWITGKRNKLHYPRTTRNVYVFLYQSR